MIWLILSLSFTFLLTFCVQELKKNFLLALTLLFVLLHVCLYLQKYNIIHKFKMKSLNILPKFQLMTLKTLQVIIFCIIFFRDWKEKTIFFTHKST